MVSNHTYTFPPSMLNHFHALNFKKFCSRIKNVAKSHFWVNRVFRLLTQFEQSNLNKFSILRSVLETSDWAEFKNVPKLDDISKIAWITSIQKNFLGKVEWVKNDQKWRKLVQNDLTLNDHISVIFQVFLGLSSS